MSRNRLQGATLLLPLVLTGVALRALVPAGYMPATAGSGLLFELCHERLPAGFMAALAADDGHTHHHASHDRHGEHGKSFGDCSMGHLLLLAAVETVEPAGLPEFGWLPSPIERTTGLYAPRRSHASSPRGPPAA